MDFLTRPCRYRLFTTSDSPGYGSSLAVAREVKTLQDGAEGGGAGQQHVVCYILLRLRGLLGRNCGQRQLWCLSQPPCRSRRPVITAQLCSCSLPCSTFAPHPPSLLDQLHKTAITVLSTQKTVAPFEFTAGLEIEMKFISNRRNWRFEISIRDQQPSSTNIKLDPDLELRSFDLGSGKMLVQPGISLAVGTREGCQSESAQLPGDAAGRRGSLGDLQFLPPFRSGAAPYSPRVTLIGSKDHAVKSRPNLSTHSVAPGGDDSRLSACTTVPRACKMIAELQRFDSGSWRQETRGEILAMSPFRLLIFEFNPDRLPPRESGFNSRPRHRIFAFGNRAGRCRWSVGFLGDLPLLPHFHSGADPYSPQSPSSALKTTLLYATIQCATKSLPEDLLSEPVCKQVWRFLWSIHYTILAAEQRRNDGTGVTGDPRENLPVSSIARHDSHMRRSRASHCGVIMMSGYPMSTINTFQCFGEGSTLGSLVSEDGGWVWAWGEHRRGKEAYIMFITSQGASRLCLKIRCGRHYLLGKGARKWGGGSIQTASLINAEFPSAQVITIFTLEAGSFATRSSIMGVP
ncbi:hypothetical protein PR048_015260 [Dryococelus australis]|uniref:Uncharacterized protein n=1 Tax=Dryococelus australis TaxID=614101 RepID=A0ABQ9HGQ4_9NEOP|nr:hypothetical protein PR048_015260 [Dryococelus australis]